MPLSEVIMPDKLPRSRRARQPDHARKDLDGTRSAIEFRKFRFP
jgi:hypothetical protein